jgi:hypothetical protein
MSEWWTYRPDDFLLFSERVYWRLFELHNRAVWPAQWVAMALGIAILVFVFRPSSRSGRIVSVTMSLAWLFVAWAYHWNAYATINWAARYAALLFAAEAALFAWFGGIRHQLTFAMQRSARSVLGIALIIYAVFLHPLVALVDGRPIASAEIFGLAPDPTAVTTLGLLGLSSGGGAILLLLAAPVTWCLVSWATLATMGTWEGWIPFAAVVFAVLTRPWQGHRTARADGLRAGDTGLAD